MTPKEKSKELFTYFRTRIIKIHCPNCNTDEEYFLSDETAKECVLKTIEEIENVMASALFAVGATVEDAENFKFPYIEKLKKEIELLCKTQK